MPTGFEKFKEKALKEEPITIGNKAETSVQETPAKTTSRASRTVEEPVVEKKSNKRRRDEMADLVTITVQLQEETKRKLDEMKFREKRKIWELTDEAINDLYKKLYR